MRGCAGDSQPIFAPARRWKALLASGAKKGDSPREVTLYRAPSFWPNRKDLPLPQTPPDHKTPQADDEPPPFLGTWRRIYAFVLIHLALWILVFYFFTERFHSPL